MSDSTDTIYLYTTLLCLCQGYEILLCAKSKAQKQNIDRENKTPPLIHCNDEENNNNIPIPRFR